MSQLGAHPRGKSRPCPVAGPRRGRLTLAGALLAVGAALLAMPDALSPGPGGTRADPSAASALGALAVTVLLATWLVHRRRPSGPLLLLGTAPAVSLLGAGVVLDAGPPVGARSDGLLALGVLVLAVAVALGSWHTLPAGSVTFERRTRRLVGVFLLEAAGAVVAARSVTAWVAIGGGGAPVDLLAGPGGGWAGTALDLLFLSAAAVAGTGLLRRAAWAGAAAFATSGCLGLIGLLVAAEARGGTLGPLTGSPGTGWIAPVAAVTATVPAVLCWVAVVRTGRQHWRGPADASTVPVPSPRPPLVPAPRRPRDDVAPSSRALQAVAERTARRSGT